MPELPTRKEWEDVRVNHLGVSECAAVLGIDPTYDALSIYERKVHGYTLKDNKILKHGRLMEEPIAVMYADETERKVTNPGATLYQYHPEHPWLAATLDRVVEGSDLNPAPAGGPGALEIKNIEIPGFNPDTWEPNNEALLKFVIQNQLQMACASYEWGSLAAKFPYYNVQWFDHIRNDKFLEAVYPVLEEFWNRVINRDPPPPGNLPGSVDVCKRIWSVDDGTTVELDGDDLVMIDQWMQAKAESNDASKRAKTLEAKIRFKMQEHTFGNLPNGSVLSAKTTMRKGYTVEPVEYRTLRLSRPKEN